MRRALLTLAGGVGLLLAVRVAVDAVIAGSPAARSALWELFVLLIILAGYLIGGTV